MDLPVSTSFSVFSGGLLQPFECNEGVVREQEATVVVIYSRLVYIVLLLPRSWIFSPM